jgi:hypothetical protein
MGCTAAVIVSLAALVAAERRTDRWRRAQRRAAALPTPNAFDHYLRAASLVQMPSVYTPDPYPACRAEGRRSFLDDNADALRVLRSGFGHAYAEPPEHAAAWDYEYYNRCRRLARVLTWEADEHAARGDAAAALASQLDALRLGVDLERGAQIMELTTCLGIQAHARQDDVIGGRIHHLDAQDATAAARRLSDILDTEILPVEILRTQRDLMPYIWRLHRRRRKAKECPKALLRWRLFGGLMFRIYLHYLDDMEAWADTGERGAMPGARGPIWWLFHRVAGPGGDALDDLDEWWLNRAENERLVCALALQAWFAAHGAYPDTLDALVPEILDELPRNPFADVGTDRRGKRFDRSGRGVFAI